MVKVILIWLAISGIFMAGFLAHAVIAYLSSKEFAYRSIIVNLVKVFKEWEYAKNTDGGLASAKKFRLMMGKVKEMLEEEENGRG